jgi:hypothetical protein
MEYSLVNFFQAMPGIPSVLLQDKPSRRYGRLKSRNPNYLAKSRENPLRLASKKILYGRNNALLEALAASQTVPGP